MNAFLFILVLFFHSHCLAEHSFRSKQQTMRRPALGSNVQWIRWTTNEDSSNEKDKRRYSMEVVDEQPREHRFKTEEIGSGTVLLNLSNLAEIVCSPISGLGYDYQKAKVKYPYLRNANISIPIKLACTERRLIRGRYRDFRSEPRWSKLTFKYSDCSAQDEDGLNAQIRESTIAMSMAKACGNSGPAVLVDEGRAKIGISRISVKSVDWAERDEGLPANATPQLPPRRHATVY